MSATTGFKVAPTLDGIHLAAVSPESVEIAETELKGNLEMADGSLREHLLYGGDGFPEVLRRWRFVIDYRHLGVYLDAVEEALGYAGPHELVLWKHVPLCYRGDGARTEFYLPGSLRHALHVVTPPPGLPPERFAAEVKLDGEPLAPQDLATAAYDGGQPDAGEVWFETGGRRLKLLDPPAVDARLVVRIVPVFLAVTSAEAQTRRYQDPAREPRRLTLEAS